MIEGNRIKAMPCKQWLIDWNEYQFPKDHQRKKPEESMYVFSMPAHLLRRLSGVYTRTHQNAGASGIQRQHDRDRSGQIAGYIKTGYPFGGLSKKEKANQENSSLKKPGWLPTAIVINFLQADDERRGKKVHIKDLLSINSTKELTEIIFPEGATNLDWKPTDLAPIEIIDGQHRLYAFEQADLPDDFELPVVAYNGLDIGWQAYLFWSINVSPKKINPSHAYDLFPLLRTQDWLEKDSNVHVYREARAQELVDSLYRYSESPWKNRINMLGVRKAGFVTQAGWVKSIYESFLSIGRTKQGLFAANLDQTQGPLNWNRAQQAAMLIFSWQKIRDAVKNSSDEWALKLRENDTSSALELHDENYDEAFMGSTTLLNQEQGVRGICLILNSLLFNCATTLKLQDWDDADSYNEEFALEDIGLWINKIKQQEFSGKLEELAKILAKFDWRSSNDKSLSAEEALYKSAFRGTGGYGKIRTQLLDLISKHPGFFQETAKNLILHAQK